MVASFRAGATGAGTLTPEEAFCAFAAHAVYIDGTVSREEQDALIERLQRLHPAAGSKHGERATRKTLARVNKMVRARGEDPVLRAAAAALAPTQRGTAYAIAAALAHSDHDVGVDEDAYLLHVRSLLGLTQAAAAEAVRELAARES
jgi:urease accessory protein UreF